MSKKMIESFLFLVLSFGIAHAQQNKTCAGAGSAAWSKQVRSLLADCETRIMSPDGQETLLMKGNGKLSLSSTKGGPLKAVGYTVEPPAMVSWAPNSSAFFIDDGQGSGMWSKFRLFRIENGHVTRDDSIDQTAVRRFREKVRCPPSASDPSVWGFGWSSDGKQVFLLVQATVNEPCGEQGTFIVLIVNLADSSVIEQLTEKQTKKRFRSLLPDEVFAK
jgi:hypothetical protein